MYGFLMSVIRQKDIQPECVLCGLTGQSETVQVYGWRPSNLTKKGRNDILLQVVSYSIEFKPHLLLHCPSLQRIL